MTRWNETGEHLEDEGLHPWNPDWLEDPEFKREYAAYKRKLAFYQRMWGWMEHVPVVGYVAFTFWFCLFTEGPRATLNPYWGSMAFSFLNDGERPTVWHTWYSMTHREGPYVAIYPRGAPKSRAQAAEWEAKWATERALAQERERGPEPPQQAR